MKLQAEAEGRYVYAGLGLTTSGLRILGFLLEFGEQQNHGQAGSGSDT